MVGIRWEFVPFQKSHFEFETDHNGLLDSNDDLELIGSFAILAGNVGYLIYKQRGVDES